MATRKSVPKAPPRVTPNKFLIALKHKNMDVFKFDAAAEEDQNYIKASERFMEFQTQLGMVVHHTSQFRKTLEESLQQAVELADDFTRLSAGQGGEREVDPWAKQAGEHAFSLKGMLEESVVSLRRHLCDELDEKMMRPLNEAVADFSGVHAQMVVRSEMKIESFHYANKVNELKGSQKATDEKKDRNKGKYATASQGLRDQTNQLMATFAKAEQVRERLLKEDLPSVIIAKRNAFDSFAINLNRAAAEATAGEPRPPRMSDAARIPQRVMPSSDFPTTPPNKGLTVVSLDDESPRSEPPPCSSPVRVEPPGSAEVTQTIVKKRSPLPMTPKEDGAPWSGSGGAGEFGDELKRAHEHQNTKMAAESAAAATAVAAGLASTPKGAPTDSVTSASGDGTAAAAAARSPTPRSESSPRTPPSSGGGGGDGSVGGASGFNDRTAAADTAGAAAATVVAAAAAVEERPETTSTPDEQQQEQQPPPEEESPAHDEGGTTSSAPVTPPEDSTEKSVAAAEEPERDGDAAAAGGGGERGEEEGGELEPGQHRLRALYDYDATEVGDLSFRAGDMIISDEGAFSGSGWASGQCHGSTGNFPANYTEPW